MDLEVFCKIKELLENEGLNDAVVYVLIPREPITRLEIVSRGLAKWSDIVSKEEFIENLTRDMMIDRDKYGIIIVQKDKACYCDFLVKFRSSNEAMARNVARIIANSFLGEGK